jgi:3-phenylpropionate/trans-cinnamate dioxygenase ferredoxin subunit
MAEYVTVAMTSDLEPGDMLRVLVDNFPVCLYNVEGEYYATQDTCTHADASLSEGDLYDDRVMCPLHGSEFDVKTGEALSFPATFPLATFPVRVEGDQVQVLVDR